MEIVLVDPSRTVRRIVGDMIGTWGYKVQCFASGEEALAHIQTCEICTLVTSIELDAMSGTQLCATARSLAGSGRAIYIILMSSTDESSKVVEALDNGADDFMAKPPASAELRARLRAAERITLMQARLIKLATTDHLTGLLTRRAFFDAAGDLLRKATRGQPLSVLICDLDKFKAINDTYGHEAGDRVLKEVGTEAKLLGIPVGRLGGEEIAFLVDASLDDALDLAEHFRTSVAGLTIPRGDKSIRVSCSIGAAEWEPRDTIDALLRRADVSLYEAKRLGRNRVIAADSYSWSDGHEQWRGVARVDLRKRRSGA